MGQHTFDEIHSQPDIWRRTLETMRATASPLAELDSYGLKGPVLFTGCGSSYYLALSAAAAWSRFAGVPGMALSATDVMMYPECHFPVPTQGTVVAISRSGKTVETLDAICHLKQGLAGRLSAFRAMREAPSWANATPPSFWRKLSRKAASKPALSPLRCSPCCYGPPGAVIVS